ncbi:hypothetical protein [Riemerella anatipestifer]|uniref:DUF551 domain-containing protein n=1 Tax=Riemerella anatipestifer TaxID=34085 RepID=A0A1S7DQG3_RIEAN|nr:hypothetical protein [Riemerella anatipestifer]AQY21359.1 hypothetical protein AB406_0400 [Riemerella anatipestifer]MDD1539428.1 hypothetical protein [Riemerella anatipestifer]
MTTNNWKKTEEELPNENETVWITNGKGWVALGCLVYAEGGYLWGISNGEIYPQDGKIMTEADLEEDLDVVFWHSVPDMPKI